ncbi:hypothetical protein [Sphingobium sp.]
MVEPIPAILPANLEIREDRSMKLNVGVPNSMHVAAMTQAWEYSLTGDDI